MAEEIIDFAELECLRCRHIMSDLGKMSLRTGGTSGKWNFFLGGVAALGEEVFYVVVYRCPNCGHVEFYDFDMNLPTPPEREQE